MTEKQPLTLEEARESNCCRICHAPIEVTCQPVGWKDRFEKLLYPVHVVLNAGQEFAHKDCLPPELPKPTPEQKPKNSSLDYWTHTYSDGKEKLGHTSDCHFWGAKICDCGLLTHLRFSGYDAQDAVYPNYQEEMAQHERRIEALRWPESFIARTEQLIRQQALHYQERPCDDCGQIIIDVVVNTTPKDPDSPSSDWPRDKPMFIADLFNQNKGPDDSAQVKTYCRECR